MDPLAVYEVVSGDVFRSPIGAQRACQHAVLAEFAAVAVQDGDVVYQRIAHNAEAWLGDDGVRGGQQVDVIKARIVDILHVLGACGSLR